MDRRGAAVLTQVAAHFGVALGDDPVTIPRPRKDFPGLLAALGCERGAEIGVWEGQFSEWICRGVPGVDLLCVDPWRAYGEYLDAKNDQANLDAAYQTASARLVPFGCRVWRMSSVEAAARVPDGSLDFVYIDGNHARAFVKADLRAWTPKVRRGGIVAGHDYTTRSKHIEVKSAVDAFVRRRGISPLFVLAADKYPSFFWVAA